jgi:hypothetical protein
LSWRTRHVKTISPVAESSAGFIASNPSMLNVLDFVDGQERNSLSSTAAGHSS